MTLMECGSPPSIVILPDTSPQNMLPSFRKNSASKLLQIPFSLSLLTNTCRSPCRFQTRNAIVDCPIASSREYPDWTVKASLSLLILPSSRREMTAASGLVLKISSICSFDSVTSAFSRWLIMMINPYVQAVPAMMASTNASAFIGLALKNVPAETPLSSSTARTA